MSTRLCLAALFLFACVEDTADPEPELDAAADAAVDAAQIAPDAGPDAAPDAAPPAPDAAPIVPCADEDDLAPNQRPGDAAPIDAGFARDDLFACPDTTDYFALTLAAGEVAKIALVADPEAVDLDLRVTDPEGAEVAGSFGEDGDESLDFRAGAAGTYLVQVESYRGQTGRYSITVRRGCRLDDACGDGVCDSLAEACVPFTAPGCGADDGEPNDRHDQATAIDEGAVRGALCPGDRDWFAIDAREGDIWSIAVGFDAGQNVDVVVLGPTGRLVDAALGDGTQNPERVTLSHTPAGRYLIGLSMPSEPGARATDFNLVATAASGACAIDRDCLSLGLPRCDAGVCREAPDTGEVKPGGRCGRGADCSDASAFCFQGDPGGHDNVCTRQCEDADDCADLGETAVCDRTFFGSVCFLACRSDDDCSLYNRCDRERGDCRLRGRCNSDRDCAATEFCSDGFGFGGVCELRQE